MLPMPESVVKMKCILAVLLCVASVLGEEPQTHTYYAAGGHGTTVCIEIRPSGPHSNPTKVCGPVVHGGNQPRPQHKSEPTVFNVPQGDHQGSELDASRQVENSCGNVPKVQNYQMGQPQAYIPRVDMPPEGIMPMMPMMPMEFEGSGWRQTVPPLTANQRAAAPMPMPYPAPMMLPPMQSRPPMSMGGPRSWLIPAQQMMMHRAAEGPIKQVTGQRDEEEQLKQIMGQRAAVESVNQDMEQRAEEEPSKSSTSATKKESLEALLKECEEKTKLLQEKEAKITELKSQIVNSKKEPDHKESVKKITNESKQ